MSKGRSNGPHKHCECEPFRCGTRLFFFGGKPGLQVTITERWTAFICLLFWCILFFIGALVQFDSHDTTSIGMNRVDIIRVGFFTIAFFYCHFQIHVMSIILNIPCKYLTNQGSNKELDQRSFLLSIYAPQP